MERNAQNRDAREEESGDGEICIVYVTLDKTDR